MELEQIEQDHAIKGADVYETSTVSANPVNVVYWNRRGRESHSSTTRRRLRQPCTNTLQLVKWEPNLSLRFWVTGGLYSGSRDRVWCRHPCGFAALPQTDEEGPAAASRCRRECYTDDSTIRTISSRWSL